MDDRKKLTFPKNERISRKRHLDLLFAEGKSFVAYPLRIIYFPIKKEHAESTVSVVISVSKKRFKHAVDRNMLKRRIRESYRQQKHELIDFFTQKDSALLVAFLYISNDKASYEIIDKGISKAIYSLKEKYG
ncbi:MAG: ribonuclease P protein component [Tannerella sp.]|jgi:ribonuclease P protein component|nr:ribonuclease P protein component [Tannerella sp.]